MIRIDGSNIIIGVEKLKKIPDNYPNAKMMADIGNFVSARIKVRTQSGLDVNLKPFVSYSSGYKKFREKKGRQIEHVDLTFSGKMLAAVSTGTITASSVTIGIFSGIEQRKGLIHQLGLYRGGKTKKREFIGVGDADKTELAGIEKINQAALDKAVQETTK
jgi:hypothetical protein